MTKKKRERKKMTSARSCWHLLQELISLKIKQSWLKMIYGHVSSSQNINKKFHCTFFEPEK